MHSRLLRTPFRVLILALVFTMPAVLFAQVAPAAQGPTQNDSRWDIFGGYSYLYLPASTEVNGHPYQSNDFGLIGSVARYFNRNIGLEMNFDTHPRIQQHNDGMWGGQTGIIYRMPDGKITPFAHALIGFQHVGGPYQQGNIGPDVGAGFGVDFRINNYVSWRFFQGDYTYSHVNFGVNGRGNFNEIRMSDGLVFHFGSVEPPAPVTLKCELDDKSPIFQGDPMSVTATAGSLDPKDSVSYTWAGVALKGDGNKGTVDTSNLAPGDYVVKATIVQNKPAKHGLAALCDHCGGGGIGAGDVATCSATYTVKPFDPPTLSCSADKTTLITGDKAVITAAGVSPQNRPLSYSFSASGGSIAGNGATASYDSAGAPLGGVDVTCSVSDDKGHTITAPVHLTIDPKPVPEKVHVKDPVCTLDFNKDLRRPTRVDNTAKECLDRISLDLQNDTSATAVLIGEANAKEKAATAKEEKYAEKHKKAIVVDSAAQRAVDSKEYLVTDKQIAAYRISAATGTADSQTVEAYIVPAAAVLDVSSTPVDETKVKPIVRKPLPMRHHGPVAHKPVKQQPVRSIKPPAPSTSPSVKPPAPQQ